MSDAVSRLLDAALEEATRLAALPAAAYAGNAQKVRGPGIERFAAAVARDRAATTSPEALAVSARRAP